MQTSLLRLNAVMARTGLSRSTIYLRISQGRFPKQVPLDGRAVAWIESEIDQQITDWVDQTRSGDQPRTSASDSSSAAAV